MDKWQAKWSAGDLDFEEAGYRAGRPIKGRQTFIFLPTVTEKTGNWHSRVTRFLTGHGLFPDYLYRLKKIDSCNCICGSTQSGPVHVMDSCPYFSAHPLRTWIRENQDWKKRLISSKEAMKMLDDMADKHHRIIHTFLKSN